MSRIRVSNKLSESQFAVIKILRSYRAKVAEHQACKELYDSMFPSCVQQMSDMPMYRSDVFEPERWACKRERQVELMQESLEKMRDAYLEIEHLIDSLDGYQKIVVMRRYIFNESYEDISAKIHCHRHTARRWHDQAIDIMAEKFVHHST